MECQGSSKKPQQPNHEREVDEQLREGVFTPTLNWNTTELPVYGPLLADARRRSQKKGVNNSCLPGTCSIEQGHYFYYQGNRRIRRKRNGQLSPDAAQKVTFTTRPSHVRQATLSRLDSCDAAIG
jgi:hypothetical protein